MMTKVQELAEMRRTRRKLKIQLQGLRARRRQITAEIESIKLTLASMDSRQSQLKQDAMAELATDAGDADDIEVDLGPEVDNLTEPE